MKKILLMVVVVSLSLGGCVRPMNAHRPPRNERTHRRPTPPVDQPGSDRRPYAY